MGRSKIREHIFKLLFMSQFNTEEEMPQQLTIYFGELEELSEEERAYMEEKVRTDPGPSGGDRPIVK